MTRLAHWWSSQTPRVYALDMLIGRLVCRVRPHRWVRRLIGHPDDMGCCSRCGAWEDQQ
jgi:hypothetical protein